MTDLVEDLRRRRAEERRRLRAHLRAAAQRAVAPAEGGGSRWRPFAVVALAGALGVAFGRCARRSGPRALGRAARGGGRLMRRMARILGVAIATGLKAAARREAGATEALRGPLGGDGADAAPRASGVKSPCKPAADRRPEA